MGKNAILAIIIIVVISTTMGCRRYDRAQVPLSNKFMGVIDKNQLVPRAYRKQTFDHTPGGNSSYDQGFQAGCQTATSAMGDGLYRIRGPKIDGNRLSNDQWYLRGFQDAATFCTQAIDWETH